MHKRLSLSLLFLLLLSAPASAQFAAIVYDPSNFVQNAISAAQSVLTTIQTVLIEANQILELTPLDDFVVEGGIAESMGLLGTLVVEAEGLSYDLASLQAQIHDLFDLGTAPETLDGLTVRVAEIRQVQFESYRYAAKVQTLLVTALHTVEHLQALLGTVKAILGNMGGNQTLVQAQTVTSKHVANLDVQMAAFTRAQTVDKLSEAVVVESINKIWAKRLEDWPTW